MSNTTELLGTSALSVQLYTVRAALEEDFGGTLGRLADMGFRRVEPFALVSHADRLRSGLAAHGLDAPTAHQGLVGADLDEVFGTAADLGIGLVIEPSVEAARWQTESDVAATAEALNAAAEQAARHGLRVGYHNHHFELESRIDGRHALEVFADRLSPDVLLEVDTYWAYAGGADVPALLARLGTRVAALHVKDGDGTLDTSKQVAVGSGTLPIQDILAAAPDALRVVELDDTTGDIMEAVAASRSYLAS